MTWRERIQAARERGAFTEDDRVDASEWLTCAVGEQRRTNSAVQQLWVTPRMIEFMREPLVLHGFGFSSAVDRDDFDAADQMLDLIEDRALTLKREANP